MPRYLPILSPLNPLGDSGIAAAWLGECSERISREHYISRSVLESVGQAVRISGFPWQEPGETKDVGTSALTAKILCDHHNSLLSPLDSAANELIIGLKDAYEASVNGNLSNGTFSLPGVQIEKWMLKVLVGFFKLSPRFQVPLAVD